MMSGISYKNREENGERNTKNHNKATLCHNRKGRRKEELYRLD